MNTLSNTLIAMAIPLTLAIPVLSKTLSLPLNPIWGITISAMFLGVVVSVTSDN